MTSTAGGDDSRSRIRTVDGVTVISPARDARGRPDVDAALATIAELDSACEKVLLVTSSEIQPPIYAHPGLGAERSAKALSGRHLDSDRWCRYEQALIDAAEERGLDWRILRPSPMLGDGGRWSRLFEGAVAVMPMGFSPPVQFLHGEDFQEGLAFCAEHFDRLPDQVHLAPADALPLKKAQRLAGVRRLALPFFLLWLWCKLTGDAAVLDRRRYSFTTSGAALTDLGFTPKRGTAAALSSEQPAERLDDPFGLDRDVIQAAGRTLFSFLQRIWWRIDLHGVSKVPNAGPAILMGVHRGLVPFDAMLALHAIVQEHGRIPRFLIHPALLRFPFVGDFMRGLGGVVACRENAHWVLERGEMLGLFPEGVRGAFSHYRDAYEVQRFGRAEFVRLAVQHQATCSIFVTIGSAEVFPILGKIDWHAWKRWSGWPTFPLTPTPLPLPVKWHTLFLSPFELDPNVKAKRHSAWVYDQLQETLLAMKDRRRSWFWGRVIDEDLVSRLEHALDARLPSSE